jgi:ribonuclease BN (tRNA processing enzyme)
MSRVARLAAAEVVSKAGSSDKSRCVLFVAAAHAIVSLSVMGILNAQSQNVDGAAAPRCGPAEYLQVLGSGGPMHAEGRGGAAYAIWLSGQPSIVVDMGGDSPSALSRAGAAPASVEVILISHLHADHVSGLSDFLWGEMTARRQKPLIVTGPGGNDQDFPDTSEFLKRLIGEGGAFPAMSGLLAGDPFAVRVTTLNASYEMPQQVLTHSGVVVSALAVPHGRAPAVAYRVDAPHFKIVFAGDQSGLNPSFIEFATGADVLVLHAIVSDRAKDDRLANIVGLPGRLGSLARASEAKRVVLGHLMDQPSASGPESLWSLADLQGVMRSFRREYHGDVTLASDGTCITLGATGQRR